MRVWEVWADATTYAKWVVGAREVSGVEGSWPRTGSSFRHKVGVWPLQVRDSTSVVAASPPRHLVLEARFRPFGIARIELDVRPEGSGSRVEMDEITIAPPLARWFHPLFAPLFAARNLASLSRLEEIVGAGRAGSQSGAS